MDSLPQAAAFNVCLYWLEASVAEEQALRHGDNREEEKNHVGQTGADLQR